jgi:Spy/CpxP family protein refolding chaperone
MKRKENMKSFRMLMVLAGVVGLVYAQSVSAEDAKASAPAAAPEVKHHGPGGNPVEMLTKLLTLTAEQQTQVKAIVDEMQPQRKALMDDQAMAKEDKGAKMKELRTAMNAKIRAVLTADQQKTFDEFNAKHQRGQGEHHKAPAAQ